MFGLERVLPTDEAAALRLYLRYYREDTVLGIDLPVPSREATTGAFGSAYTMVELSSPVPR